MAITVSMKYGICSLSILALLTVTIPVTVLILKELSMFPPIILYSMFELGPGLSASVAEMSVVTITPTEEDSLTEAL